MGHLLLSSALLLFTPVYGLSTPEEALLLTLALCMLINLAGIWPGTHVAEVSLASG